MPGWMLRENALKNTKGMAEREGFEPSVELYDPTTV
jgi:hypothetical protein